MLNNEPHNNKKDNLQLSSSFNFDHFKFITNSNDYVIISNKKDKIIWVNEGFTQLTGYNSSEVLGKRPATILRGFETDDQECKNIEENVKLRIPFKSQLLNYKKDHTPIWFSFSVMPLFNDSKQFEGYVTIGSDITAIKENEIRLKNNSQRLFTINKLVSRLLAADNYEEIFESIAISIADFFTNLSNVHAVVIRNETEVIVGKGYEFEDGILNNVVDEFPIPDAKLINCLLKKDVTIVNDATRLKKGNYVVDALRKNGNRSFVILPLVKEENIVSFIVLTSSKAHAFKTDDIDLLLKVRNVLSVALKQAQLKIKIEEKNVEIKNTNHELTDSIRYAQRIQGAILPEKKIISKLLPDSFFVFMPKDIVSGDFYWLAERSDKVFFTAADCTGHGVPGAFMSMIGSSLLNQIVLGKKMSSANEILDELRRKVIITLNQNSQCLEYKDGMDMSFCVWNKKKHTLEFAAANNPGIFIRNNPTPLLDFFSGDIPKNGMSTDEQFHLYELKADRQPVGVAGGTMVPFKNHEIKLMPGDTIYLFSDGIIDQFGGEAGKKLMIKRLKTKLLEIQSQSLKDQEKIIRKFFSSWKKDFEQVDDVLITGVRF